MSEKKTILGKVVEAILSIFKENWMDFVKKLWRKIPEDLKEELNNIVGIVNFIKEQVDSPVLDVLVGLSKTDIDDKALAWLREILNDLRLADLKTSDLTKTDYHNIGTLLTEKSTGVSYGQAVITIENAYQNS